MTAPARLWFVPVFALQALLASPSGAAADELKTFAKHGLSGQDAQGGFSGWVQIGQDARYRGELQRGGAAQPLSGQARFQDRSLVLVPDGGQPQAFARADSGGKVRWRWRGGGAEWVLTQPGKDRSIISLIARVADEGRPLRWLFRDNRAAVDPMRGAEIYRSKEPSPRDLDRWVLRYHLHTVLSLNGDLDDEVNWIADPLLHKRWLWPRRVNLRDFIRSHHHLDHEVFHLSASRAPTDAELVGIFSVLLDDTRKPILLHCHAGSDRTGLIAALYEVEFLGHTKGQAKATMRAHLWAAEGGTEIMGGYLDLYQPGTIRRLLSAAGFAMPARYAQVPPGPR